MDRQGFKGMSLNDGGKYQYVQWFNTSRKHIPKSRRTHSKILNTSIDYRVKK